MISKPEEFKACLRCGSSEDWEVHELLRTEEDTDGDNIYTYSVTCTRCGRPTTYSTGNPDAIPERVKVRDELLAGSGMTFDPARKYESDTDGIDMEHLAPRLENQRFGE